MLYALCFLVFAFFLSDAFGNNFIFCINELSTGCILKSVIYFCSFFTNIFDGGPHSTCWQLVPTVIIRQSLAPDETVVTLIKIGSSGAFSLYVPFPRVALRLPGAIIVLPLWGNYFCKISLV